MKQITVEEAYRLADWATRTVCPAFLEFDDGKRKCWPEHADRLRKLNPVDRAMFAHSAMQCINKEIIPKISAFRDGLPTVPLRQALWLCMAAICIEKGYCLPTDYGSQGILDLLRYMRVPVKV